MKKPNETSRQETLPNDVARCAGVGCIEDGVQYWREGCEDCLRRTAKKTGDIVARMDPPPIIAFECEYRIYPNLTGKPHTTAESKIVGAKNQKVDWKNSIHCSR